MSTGLSDLPGLRSAPSLRDREAQARSGCAPDLSASCRLRDTAVTRLAARVVPVVLRAGCGCPFSRRVHPVVGR